MKRHSIDCQHCGAILTTGRSLCPTCEAALGLYLEFVPVYFRNLARWRPSSSGTSRPVPGSREPRLPGAVAHDRIGHLLEQTHGEFVTWLRRLAADRPALAPAIDIVEHRLVDEERVVRVGCRLLALHAEELATLPWVGDLVHALATHEALLREETERTVPGWYAGACERCGYPTYVVPGLTWVTCGACGTSTSTRDHAAVILDEARPWLARARALAAVVVALTDETDAARVHARIRQWITRDRIATYDGHGRARTSAYDPAYCRLGDVLDRLDATPDKAPRDPIGAIM